MVAQLVALLPCSKKVLGYLCTEFACIPAQDWVLSGYSLLLQSKNMIVKPGSHGKILKFSVELHNLRDPTCGNKKNARQAQHTTHEQISLTNIQMSDRKSRKLTIKREFRVIPLSVSVTSLFECLDVTFSRLLVCPRGTPHTAGYQAKTIQRVEFP
ncbi:hypothetical protein XENOCAPTIV_012804 [Xenoophorus captivus]|uniref:Uncharacterized protein n=1 Tax=Xenoophorus captivus TaxID=1517983 RepID=A0ABV0Q4Z3_9TELE